MAQLIARRQKDGAGSLRDMEARAKAAEHPISKTALSEYARGLRSPDPRDEDLLAALAAALEVTVDEVRAAALESVPLATPLNERRSQHAEAFLRLTADRSDAEVEHLLGVVSAVLAKPDRDS